MTEVLESGWITTGPKIEEFEKAFAELVDAAYAVSFGSATSAFHALYFALGYGPGDEIIFPSLTWPSPLNVLENMQGEAVMVDVDRATLQMDVEATRKSITPKTKAIVVVHFAGQPVELDGFRVLAQKHNLTLIEDAAHAIHTQYGDAQVGSSENPAVFSFHAAKNITTAEGGMVTTHDLELVKKLKSIRFHGLDRDAWKRHGGKPGGYDIEQPGWKSNLTDIQAAIGLGQLERLKEIQAQREHLAHLYIEQLQNVSELILPQRVSYPHRHGWHLFQVMVDQKTARIDRDTFREELRQRNIGTGFHFRAVHTLSYFKKKYPQYLGNLPHSEWVSDSTVSLPFFPDMNEKDVHDVVSAIADVFDRS